MNDNKEPASLNDDNFSTFTHEQLWAEIKRLKTLADQQKKDINARDENAKQTNKILTDNTAAANDARSRVRALTDAITIAGVEPQVGKILLRNMGAF